VYDRLRGEGPFSIAEPLKVMDLGTGGGFPGIPLAVMFPHAQFTLCDSIGKKIIVATEVAKGLGLENVKTVNARAESLPETFDYIVSRAVTALDNFMPWVKGKYSEGILYLKGGDLDEEIARAKLRKGSVHVWPISGWTSDPFFETKQVIFIEK
jgi:16S rRNA (guanine527-N7)-methyltransferase